MKKLYKCVLGLILASLFLCGCASSIIIPDGKVIEIIPHPDDPEHEDTEEERLIKERKAEEEKEIQKYASVSGNEAFYILPCGVALPGAIQYFKILSIGENNTNIYAYQALYDLPDQSGLGGMPVTGKNSGGEEVGHYIMPIIFEKWKKETANHPKKVQGPASKVEKMVSVVMKYNYVTREYKVLFHKIDKVKVEYVLQGESCTMNVVGEMSYMLDEIGIESDYHGLDYATMRACPIDDEKALIYYREKLITLNYEKGIIDDNESIYQLDELCNIFPGEPNEHYIWDVNNLVLDQNGRRYVLVRRSKVSTISGDDPNADVDNGKGSDQYVLSQHYLRRPEGLTFYSKNVNYENQVKEFTKYNGKTVDFTAHLGEPDDEEILDLIGRPYDVQDKYPTQYSNYVMEDKGRKFLLARTIQHVSRHEFQLLSGYIEDLSGTNLAFQLNEEVYPGKIAKPRGVIGWFDQKLPVKDDTRRSERSVLIHYREEKTETYIDTDGQEKTRTITVDKEKQYHDDAIYIQGLNAYIPIAELYWYEEASSLGDIERAPYPGVLNIKTREPENGDKGFGWIRFDDPECERLVMYDEFELYKKTQLNFGYDQMRTFKMYDMQFDYVGTNEPVPILYTDDPDNITMFFNFNTDPWAYNEKFSDRYIISRDVVTYNNYREKKNQNDPKEVGTLIMEFGKDSMHLTKQAGKAVLYYTSPQEGMVRFRMTAKKNEVSKDDNIRGQIISFPCLRFYTDKDVTKATVLGFDSTSMDFHEQDLPFARIYEVDLYSLEAIRNLITTALGQKDRFQLKSSLLALTPSDPKFTENWNVFFDNIGLYRDDPNLNWKYVEQVRQELCIKWQYTMKFARLAEIANNEKIFAIVHDIEKCKETVQLEDVFHKYTEIRVEKQKEKPPEDVMKRTKWQNDIEMEQLNELLSKKNPPMTKEQWDKELKKIIRGLTGKELPDDDVHIIFDYKKELEEMEVQGKI